MSKQNEDFELAVIDESMIADSSNLLWKSKDGKLTKVKDMTDQHLRNTALVLMGMGYQVYNVSDELKIRWLSVLRLEWERRLNRRVD